MALPPKRVRSPSPLDDVEDAYAMAITSPLATDARTLRRTCLDQSVALIFT